MRVSFKIIALIIAAQVLCAWTHGAGNANLRQQNFFGLTGSAWQNTNSYYVPGTGSPAVSTADYYHQNGMAWFRPYDLTASACGTAGATIAAANGRYVWVSSADHPSGAVWNGGNGFRIGFSNDPGIPPSTLSLFYPDWAAPNNTALVATITASISGNILTVSPGVSGLITNDGHATVSGAGVTTATITAQNTGSQGSNGTYTIDGAPQTVGSETMTVNQTGYVIYQNPFFVCNPDDASFPFYVYAEGAASAIQHEEGIIKSADLVTWTTQAPTHITPTFGSWSSYQRPVRDGTNSWHSTGFEVNYQINGGIFGRSKWTSTDGKIWTPGSTTFNSCIPSTNSSPAGSITCTSGLLYGPEAAPDSTTIGAQAWGIGKLDTFAASVRNGPQWIGRVPIDSSFNVLNSPSPVKVSSAYGGAYPGPTYVQGGFGYVEDGIAHYYGLVGFLNSSALFGTVSAATYLNGGICDQANSVYSFTGSIASNTLHVTASVNTIQVGMQILGVIGVSSISGNPLLTAQIATAPGDIATFTIDGAPQTVGSETIQVGTCGGLWEEAIDYYTEIIDATAAASAAPVGVKANCASGTVTLTWLDALPNRTYRVYRGTTAGAQATLIGDVTGITTTDTPTGGSVYYYKVVTLLSGVEKQSRVVSTFASSSSVLVNAHMTRVLAAGADPTTINRTWLDTFDAWLISNSLENDLLFATMADFGVVQNGSHVISKIFDLGTTRLPRGGDYTPFTTNTTYSATGINSNPSWVNGASAAQGYYGGGPTNLNNIRRKTQITAFAAYQKPGTAQATLLATGEFGGMALWHSSGTPGAVNFLLSDATQNKTATATISGLATDFHTIAGVFDGTNLIAYADAVAGTGVTGLVIPSPNLNPPDTLTGQVGNGQIRFLGSGSQDSKYNTSLGYVFDSNQALFSGGAQIVFDKGLTPTQITSLNTLIRTHFGF